MFEGGNSLNESLWKKMKKMMFFKDETEKKLKSNSPKLTHSFFLSFNHSMMKLKDFCPTIKSLSKWKR